MTPAPASPIDLRCGDWRTALADVGEVDALICDPPYSERTHAAYSRTTAVLTACERDARWAARGGARRTLNYHPWGEAEIAAAAAAWSQMCRGWIVVFCDDVLAPLWQRELGRTDRYVFSPLAAVEPGSRVRLVGDGPSQWSTWIIVARPRALPFSKWGTLPGAYVVPEGHSGQKQKLVIGGKPLWLMRALVRDYSRPGDLVCDPCAGGATTLLAAAIEGRRAIGAELDPKTHALACKRLARGYTPTLFDTTRPAARAEQAALFGAGDAVAADGGGHAAVVTRKGSNT